MTRFRERLLERLLAATGAGSVGLAAAAAGACGGEAIGESRSTDPRRTEGGGGDVAGGGYSGVPSSGTGGRGSGAVTNSGAATGMGGQSGILIPPVADAGRPEPNARVCVTPLADAGADSGLAACADAQAAASKEDYGWIVCQDTGADVTIDPPRFEGLACCVEVRVQCFTYVGRAFLVDEGLVKANVRKGGGWRTGPVPRAEGLSEATRRALAEAWVKDGLFEHASVATFARFAMQLLAVGAPSRLLHETLAAGRDEIRHAELCFALASAYQGEPVEPDRFPLGDSVTVNTDLVDIVTETIVEGCIGETLAALQAAEQARRASDPAVVEALEATVDDETRHAELAWRVVAWALEVGGTRVRRAIERTFAGFEPPPRPTIDLEGVSLEDFVAHGRLAPEEARSAALEALEYVVRPCAAALLGVDVMSLRPVTMAER